MSPTSTPASTSTGTPTPYLDSIQTLENLALSLVASLFYMMFLVGYVKGAYNLTLDVQDSLILAFWGVVIGVIFHLLEWYEKRSLIYYIKLLLK